MEWEGTFAYPPQADLARTGEILKVRRVFKFGGSVLADGEKVRRMAEWVYSAEGEKIVVVSAMGDTTNRMIRDYEAVGGAPEGLENYVMLGELQAMKLFSTALKSLGAQVISLHPDHPFWPLWISRKGKVVLDREKTNQPVVFRLLKNQAVQGRVMLLDANLKKGKILVMCGFVAKDYRGNKVTLGRGGSDLTAALMGEIFLADEILFVKDVEGVYTADPRLLPTRRKISVISTAQLARLLGQGTSILHPDVISGEHPGRELKVISPQHLERPVSAGDFPGTLIYPSYRESIGISPPLTQIILVGRKLSDHPREVGEILQPLQEQKIFPVSVHTEEDFCCVYVRDEQGADAYVGIGKMAYHSSLITATTMKRGLRGFWVYLPATSRYVEQIAQLIRKFVREGIRIWELHMGVSDLNIYVEEQHCDRAKELLVQWKNEIT
ncbi:MAG: amino acid kinase family protein [bacterium JZ-2024 1]